MGGLGFTEDPVFIVTPQKELEGRRRGRKQQTAGVKQFTSKRMWE